MAKPRLLVLDDEKDFREYIRKVGEGMGCEVTVASDADDFKRKYHRCAPTVIVLDIVMPDVDGIELGRYLAAQRCTATVIFVSGYHPRYVKAAKLLGEVNGLASVRMLTKPVRLSVLREALRSASRV